MTTSIWEQNIDPKAKGKDLTDALNNYKMSVDDDLKKLKSDDTTKNKLRDKKSNKEQNAEKISSETIINMANIERKIEETMEIARKMRSDNDEILKANSKYVEQKSKKFMKPEDLASNSKIKNFKYVNDYVRSNFKRAFLIFNPKVHHNKVLEYGQANEDIIKDYEDLDRQIDDDLAEVLDPHYHKKKYNEFLQRKALMRKNSQPLLQTNKLEKEEVPKEEDKAKEDEKKSKPRHKTILVNESKRKARKAKEEQVNFLNEQVLPRIYNATSEQTIGNYVDNILNDNNNSRKMKYTEQMKTFFPSIIDAEVKLKEVTMEKVGKTRVPVQKDVYSNTEKLNEDIERNIHRMMDRLKAMGTKEEEMKREMLLREKNRGNR